MRPDLTIRSVARAELPAVHAVIERAYRGDSARAGWTHEADLLSEPRTSLDVLRAIVADPRQRLIGGWHGKTPVGCVVVAGLDGGRAYLGQLCVEPHLQAAGIGRELIAAAERIAVGVFCAHAIEMTVIETRAELIAYYGRRGYAPTGERRDFPIAVRPPLYMTVLAKPLAVLAAA